MNELSVSSEKEEGVERLRDRRINIAAPFPQSRAADLWRGRFVRKTLSWPCSCSAVFSFSWSFSTELFPLQFRQKKRASADEGSVFGGLASSLSVWIRVMYKYEPLLAKGALSDVSQEHFVFVFNSQHKNRLEVWLHAVCRAFVDYFCRHDLLVPF